MLARKCTPRKFDTTTTCVYIYVLLGTMSKSDLHHVKLNYWNLYVWTLTEHLSDILGGEKHLVGKMEHYGEVF